MFHVHNDYVRQQAQHFRVRKRVADEQDRGTIPKRLERLFLQLLIHTGERLRNSRTSAVKSQPAQFLLTSDHEHTYRRVRYRRMFILFSAC